MSIFYKVINTLELSKMLTGLKPKEKAGFLERPFYSPPNIPYLIKTDGKKLTCYYPECFKNKRINIRKRDEKFFFLN